MRVPMAKVSARRSISAGRFAALAEEICTDEALRAQFPDYCHRILHIFTARPLEKISVPTELDFEQQGSVWVTFEEADQLPLRPSSLCGRITELVNGTAPVWLGTVIC